MTRKDGGSRRQQFRPYWDKVCVDLYPLIFSCALRLTNFDLDRARDLAQAVVLRLLRLCPDPGTVRNQNGFLRQTTRNLWIDSRQRPEINIDDFRESDPGNPLFKIDPEVLSILKKEEFFDLLPRKAGAVSDADWHLLDLFLKGHTLPEIATMMGWTMGSTRLRWLKVTAAMRKAEEGRHSPSNSR